MEDISDRFEDISFDAGPIQIKERKLINSFVPFIEHSFEEQDKVSFSFLFFDDVKTCLEVCNKCVDNFSFSFMSDVLDHKHFNWCDKFIECVYYLQHFQLLKKLGFKEYELGRYKFPKLVPSYRLLLYRICENLSNKETLQVMDFMPSVSPEKYLEIFILKILLDQGLKFFMLICCRLKNPVIDKLLREITEDPYFEKCKGKLTLPKSVNVSDDGIYPIKDPENVGLCFIINEVNFKGLPERLGSSEDVSLLMSTLDYFKFTVKVFTDVNAKFFDNLNKTIDIYFKKKNYSVFFLVIMTHGEADAIFSSEEQRIDISLITSKLACQSLFKIPKVLMIQACQGPWQLLKDIATDGPSSVSLDQPREKQSSVKTHVSDLLIGMSTIKGFKAYRDKTSGSFFLQSFCKCMRAHEDECIYSIMTETIREVKALSVPGKLQVMQHPEIRSLFEKKLYLKPKIKINN